MMWSLKKLNLKKKTFCYLMKQIKFKLKIETNKLEDMKNNSDLVK